MAISTILFATFLVSAGAWVPEMENNGLYEGDMVLDPDQIQEVKEGKFSFASTSNQRKLWPNAQVPYQLSPELQRNSEFMREFQHSIGEYHKYTCIRFKPRSSESGYIEFFVGGGCSSPVGYSAGRVNRVSLSQGCWWRSTIMHEIGHSLGFHHEQARPDRDNHVNILFQNVASGTRHNFDKQSYSDTNSVGTPYDYRSMMHYSWDAFGAGKMTIQTKDRKYQYEIGVGQGDWGFSQIDIQQINKLYRCQGYDDAHEKLPVISLPTSTCYDLRSCAKHKHTGQCHSSSWQTYLSKHCRKTCGFCKVTGGNGGGPDTPRPNTPRPNTPRPNTPRPDPNCRDQVIDCHKLGRHRCTDPNSAWRNYMQSKCRRYCSLC